MLSKEIIDRVKAQLLPPKRYVVTCKDGHAQAFYSTDIHEKIPPEAQLISEEDYRKFHEEQSAPKMKRHRFVDGRIVHHDPDVSFETKARLAEGAGLTISYGKAKVKFPTHHRAQQRITRVLAVISATGGFPGGVDKFSMKASDDSYKTLSLDEYKAIGGAILSYAESCACASEGFKFKGWGSDGLPSSEIKIKI